MAQSQSRRACLSREDGVAREIAPADLLAEGKGMLRRGDDDKPVAVAPEDLGVDVDLRTRAERQLQRAVKQTFHQRGAERSAQRDGDIGMRAQKALDQTRGE